MKSWCSSLLFRFTNNSGWMLPGIGAARICWRCGSEMWSRFPFIGVLLYRLENMERKLFICARRHEELKERYTSHVTDLGQCLYDLSYTSRPMATKHLEILTNWKRADIPGSSRLSFWPFIIHSARYLLCISLVILLYWLLRNCFFFFLFSRSQEWRLMIVLIPQ